MKRLRIVSAMLLMVLLCGCGAKKDDGLLLHLTFDEGSGITVSDAAGKAGEGELAYVLNKSPFGTQQEPQWRSSGVSGDLDAAKGKLDIILYIDRSLVEAYFNDTKSISVRSYAEATSLGMYLEADGDCQIEYLYVAPMNSIY